MVSMVHVFLKLPTVPILLIVIHSIWMEQAPWIKPTCADAVAGGVKQARICSMDTVRTLFATVQSPK